METSNEAERQKLDAWERKQLDSSLKVVATIVAVLFTFVCGMKIGAELNTTRVVKKCTAGGEVDLRGSLFKCSKP